eukprot:4167453-Pyramimonas_sp.AAC.1
MDVNDHQQLTDTMVREVATTCYGAGRLTPIQPYITTSAMELARLRRYAAKATRTPSNSTTTAPWALLLTHLDDPLFHPADDKPWALEVRCLRLLCCTKKHDPRVTDAEFVGSMRDFLYKTGKLVKAAIRQGRAQHLERIGAEMEERTTSLRWPTRKDQQKRSTDGQQRPVTRE